MIKVLISGDSRYPLNRKLVKKAVFDTLAANKVEDMDAEISVYVVGKRKMKVLGEKFMKDGILHDVISFPLEELEQEHGAFVSPPGESLVLGDIVLCWPELLLSAASADVMVDQQVYDLVCHSTEHLLGKHHED